MLKFSKNNVSQHRNERFPHADTVYLFVIGINATKNGLLAGVTC